MKAFHFSLERVLNWRELQARTAETKLANLRRQRDELKRQADQLRLDRERAEHDLIAGELALGSSLAAFASFLVGVEHLAKKLAQKSAECDRQIAIQLKEVLRCRKDYRILEKLKQRRREQWQYAYDREAELAATSSYLAQWTQRDPCA